MSEKRFKLIKEATLQYHICENEIQLSENQIVDLLNSQSDALLSYDKRVSDLKKENEQLQKKLECCEYSHFLNELEEIHKKIDKGDYSDFKTLKQEEKDKQIEEDYARLQRRKILERSGNCKPLTLKYDPKYFTLKIWDDE